MEDKGELFKTMVPVITIVMADKHTVRLNCTILQMLS